MIEPNKESPFEKITHKRILSRIFYLSLRKTTKYRPLFLSKELNFLNSDSQLDVIHQYDFVLLLSIASSLSIIIYKISESLFPNLNISVLLHRLLLCYSIMMIRLLRYFFVFFLQSNYII